jgi:hypothetical protein
VWICGRARAAEGKDAEKEDAGPVLGVRGKVTRRGAGRVCSYVILGSAIMRNGTACSISKVEYMGGPQESPYDAMRKERHEMNGGPMMNIEDGE